MKTKDKKSIEAYMNDLETIVASMSDNAVSLDEAVRLYKEGMAAVKDAEALLNAYEQEVSVLNLNEDMDHE